jgi:DHA2 family multidrug resistance protein-like MFS transporter
MHDTLESAALSDQASATAEHSVTGAVAVAGQIGGSAGDDFANAAKVAFVDGLHGTSIVAGGIALVGALIALAFLPARSKQSEDVTDVAPAEVDDRGLIGV